MTFPRIPTGRRDVAPLLRTFFRRVGRGVRREALAAYASGRPLAVDRKAWANALAAAVSPLLRRYFFMGVRRQLASSRRPRALATKMMRVDTVKASVHPRGGVLDDSAWSVFNPEVELAIQQAALRFATSTLNTAIGNLEDAIERTREAVLRGLLDGDPLQSISAAIKDIFDDGTRAYNIAHNEVSRAVHTGQRTAARDDGMTRKRWLESEDACPRCKRYGAMGDIPIEMPYDTAASKNPNYAVVMGPPGHVGCFCSEVYE